MVGSPTPTSTGTKARRSVKMDTSQPEPLNERVCPACGAPLRLTYGRSSRKFFWHHPPPDFREEACVHRWNSIQFEERAEAEKAVRIFKNQPTETNSPALRWAGGMNPEGETGTGDEEPPAQAP
jgi:hypothetical protein